MEGMRVLREMVERERKEMVDGSGSGSGSGSEENESDHEENFIQQRQIVMARRLIQCTAGLVQSIVTRGKEEEPEGEKTGEKAGEQAVVASGARALQALATTVRECERILPGVFGPNEVNQKNEDDEMNNEVDRMRIISMLGDACVSMQDEIKEEKGSMTSFEMPDLLWLFLSQNSTLTNNALPEYGMTESTLLPSKTSSTTWWLQVGVFCYVTAIFSARRQRTPDDATATAAAAAARQQQHDLQDLYHKLGAAKNDQGQHALKENDTSSALDFFSSALNLFQQVSDIVNVGWIKLNLVQCLRVMVTKKKGLHVQGGEGETKLTTEISSLYATSLELCNEILTVGKESTERSAENGGDTTTTPMLHLMRSAEDVLARVSLDYAIALRFAVKDAGGVCTKETFHLVQRHFQKSVELGKRSRLLCGQAHYHQGLFAVENIAANLSNQQRNAVCELARRQLLKSLSFVKVCDEEDGEEEHAALCSRVQEALKMVKEVVRTAARV